MFLYDDTKHHESLISFFYIDRYHELHLFSFYQHLIKLIETKYSKILLPKWTGFIELGLVTSSYYFPNPQQSAVNSPLSII